MAAMVAAAVHVAMYLKMVVVVAPFDPAQWVSVGTICVPFVAAQREWPLLLVSVDGLLDRHPTWIVWLISFKLLLLQRLILRWGLNRAFLH